NQVRETWTRRYGANTASRMLAGASGMAYDSRFGLGRARDQDPDDETSGMGQIKVFLKNRLSPEDFARLEQMMQALSGGEQDDESNHQQDPMPNQPKGRYAQDARGQDYFSQFGNAHVGFSDYGSGSGR